MFEIYTIGSKDPVFLKKKLKTKEILERLKLSSEMCGKKVP